MSKATGVSGEAAGDQPKARAGGPTEEEEKTEEPEESEEDKRFPLPPALIIPEVPEEPSEEERATANETWLMRRDEEREEALRIGSELKQRHQRVVEKVFADRQRHRALLQPEEALPAARSGAQEEVAHGGENIKGPSGTIAAGDQEQQQIDRDFFAEQIAEYADSWSKEQEEGGSAFREARRVFTGGQMSLVVDMLEQEATLEPREVKLARVQRWASTLLEGVR